MISLIGALVLVAIMSSFTIWVSSVIDRWVQWSILRTAQVRIAKKER